MEINFEGKSYQIGQDMWDAMCSHAAEREITIDEYIAEAFTLLRKEKLLRQSNSEQNTTDRS